MILFKDKKDCCGCTACAKVCSTSAIQMLPDEEGFVYPQINQSLCIDCGICKKVCAFQNGYDTSNNLSEPFVYAVRHKDKNELLTSRSGGMFIAISDYILNNKGVVYGVGYTDHFRVVHKRATTKIERNEFKGSKYVQSDLNDTFEQVKNDLRNGLLVFFSGTPCHTAGLYTYLRNVDTKNLFVCDIVCHGVPSPFIWKDYIHYIENKYKDTVVEFNFRDKKFGWSSHIESFVLKNNKKKKNIQTYTDMFYKHITLRPSCGICKYTNLKRPSDITLADYWGWEKVSIPFNNDNKGVSLVLVNTEKGKNVFDIVKSDIYYLESNTTDCLQPNLQNSTKFSPLREKFWKDYSNNGFLFIAKEYGNLGLKNQIKKSFGKGKAFLKRIIKKIIC